MIKHSRGELLKVLTRVVEPEPDFLLEPEPVKKFQLRAVAVWLRGNVVAK